MKRIHSDFCHCVGDVQPGQRDAAGLYACHRLWDGQSCQRAAAEKGVVPNLSHTVWYVQTGQRATTSKGMVSNRRHTGRNCQTPQRAAAAKGAILYACRRLWDGQSCQRAAAEKGAPPICVTESGKANLVTELQPPKA